MPMPPTIPDKWEEARLHVFMELARHDSQINSLHGEVALARESLQGKAKQDVDAAHDKIRQQRMEIEGLRGQLLGKRRQQFTINSALAAAVVGLVEIVKWLLPHLH